MNPSADLVNSLWRLCALLRKDGVTYQQYVTELTYLLFLKMASEQKDESRIPDAIPLGRAEVGERDRGAAALPAGADRAGRRRPRSPTARCVAIFQNAATIVREPANLRKLIDAIDGLHWFSEERDAFGDAYEGLLQKMAEETKRGAGQYFTPRVLIDVMVRLMQPQAGRGDPGPGGRHRRLPDRGRPAHARRARTTISTLSPQAAGVPAAATRCAAWRTCRTPSPAADEPAPAQDRPGPPRSCRHALAARRASRRSRTPT